MVNVMNALKPDAMTFHWEFTLGSERVNEIVEGLAFRSPRPEHLSTPNGTSQRRYCSLPTKCLRARWNVNIAVIGQAFPYMPIANPALDVPGILLRDSRRAYGQQMVDESSRSLGAECVVVLSS